MAELETDYLVVGAGAAGMAFTDALMDKAGADVVLVDRRHRPGGHWNDDYPFVRLHQPSAYYGVNSRPLGHDRIDEAGPNAGFYERATAAELCDYYSRVLHEQFLPSGRVRFFGMQDYVFDGAGDGAGQHVLRSRVTGDTTTVKVRRRLVDATQLESTIPSRHTPSFGVDGGVRLVAPNDLVQLADGGSGFTVIGAGKTSMDTCCWLIEHGVSPDDIRWIRPREAWTVDRTLVQPLKQLAGAAEWIALQIEASVEAESPADLVRRLEASGVFIALDPDAEPTVFRGVVLSEDERTALRSIENVVRRGRVLHIGTGGIDLEAGSIPTDLRDVHVDCTAAGLGTPSPRPIFEPGRITLQRVQAGIDPFSAAVIGTVEAIRDDDDHKNRLCPPNPMSGEAIDFAYNFFVTQQARARWTAEPDLNEWVSSTRLSPFRDLGEHVNEAVGQALTRIVANTGPAIENLERITTGSGARVTA